MIFGVGMDLVEVARVEDGLARHGEQFARRILCDSEWQAFRDARMPAAFLAKRFAAKEALGKAAGTGIRAPVLLRSICVETDELGKPALRFAPALEVWMAERAITRAHVSISDERATVAAVVVLEARDTPAGTAER
ncbi:MAG: holo-ACP synthase [Betaproteobacteria bacterium]|nr:holo-ACP synthase [Betaproteobacteria bacterium]